MTFEDSRATYLAKAKKKREQQEKQREKRFAPLPPSTKDEQGRRLCRWCKNLVPKGRLTFCGEPCVHEYKIRSDAGYIRKKVFERDKGVCAACKLDTAALAEEARRSYTVFLEYTVKYPGLSMTRRTGGWWQADHILEVISGGGRCGLANLPTLCVACHKQKTKELAGKRAAARKAAKREPDLFTK